MGIFKKSNKDNLFLLFPDGREVNSPDDIKEIRNKYRAEVLFKIGKTSNIIYSKGEEIVQQT